MYFVYVLQSKKDSRYYYGLTRDLENRLKEHNNKSVPSTKARAPLALMYFEEVETLALARKREKYFKSGFGRKYVKGKIEHKGPIV